MIPIADSEKSRRFPLFNLLFIGINLVVFYLQLTALNPEAFIYQYALIPSQINFANLDTLYPFITSMFLHGGLLHIGSNMLFLWVFGDNVEGHLPFFVYPLLYLGAGVVGSLAQYLMDPSSSIPMLGASGAVAGALGAYFTLFPHHRIKTLVILPLFITIVEISAVFMLGYWIVLQLISGAGSFGATPDQGGVAYFAHIGGFVYGYIFAKVFANTQPEELRRIA